MFTRDIEAQLDYDFHHVHSPNLTVEPRHVVVTSKQGSYGATYYLSACGAWLPDFAFAYGEVDCISCQAVEHLANRSNK